MPTVPFHVTDWNSIASVRHDGVKGFATWKSVQHGDLRIQLVEYSPGYVADHWCTKGHLTFCLQGSMTTELKDGRKFELGPGMSYEVSDELSEHQSSTLTGVSLLIVDGGFLNQEGKAQN